MMKKGSETVVIRRSQINLNPINPKKHTDEQIKLQRKNLKKVGFLGGIVWNSETGNLVDGHRRVKAMDLDKKYDGTPETDYDIKVEKVEFDDKTEKEQLTYMAVGNSKADFNLIARYVDDIDYSNVGLSEDDYRKIQMLSDRGPDVDTGMESYDDFITPPDPPVYELPDEDEKTSEDFVREHEEKPKMTKDEVKKEKQHCDNVASGRQSSQDLYVFLSFENFENKMAFCELMGFVPTNSMMIKGEEVMRLIQ